MCTEHGLTRSGLEPTIYRTRGEHANDYIYCPGADPGFQVRGGGGHLKKIAPSGGRHEIFWGISCEKSRFYAKKIIFLSNFRMGSLRVRPSPPGSAPVVYINDNR